MRLVEADANQHLYHTCYTMRLQVREYVLQVIRENLTSWKQTLTNEVNKSQTFRLLYSNPYEHTHITQQRCGQTILGRERTMSHHIH